MRCHLIRFHKMVKGSPTPQGCTHKLPRKSLPGSWGTFSRVGKPCSVSEGHFPGWEKLARFPRDISPGRKSLLGFRGTFLRAGKACSVSEGHFPGWENLARFPRDIFPSRKTLPRCAGTFSQAGKACRAAQEHFPGRKNLAALRRNISPSGKSLPRCAGTLSLVGKPCRAARQHFYEHENLAAFCGRVSTIICSPPSFPIRPHQGVCDTPLQLAAKNLHEMMPSITASHRTNGKYVGAQRHTPSMAGTLTKNGTA